MPIPEPSLAAPTLPTSHTGLRNERILEEMSPSAIRAIRDLPWVADGVSPAERATAESLIYIAGKEPASFGYLTKKPWLASGSARELDAVLTALESISLEDPAFVRQIVAMPFLDTLDSPDLAAMESLAYLAYSDFAAFRRVMTLPDIRDGIDDEEAKIVALLGDVNSVNPSLVDVLLDSSQISVEERTIELPLSDRLALAVIRTSPGAARSMDLLEHSVRTAELFMAEPFPRRYVALLFENSVTGSFAGFNVGTHIAILPEHDFDSGSYEAESASRIIAHEVAHYYWNHGENWLDEGAAEFMAAIAEEARIGLPSESDNYPCSPIITLNELEKRDYAQDTAGYVCNYAQGERLFLDLYRSIGDDAFRQGFRRLYLAANTLDDDPDHPAGIKQLRAAFKSNTTDTTKTTNGAAAEAINAEVDRVIARWYDGAESYDTGSLDNSPVVAQLPSVNGWIDRAYVALTEQGRPVNSFSTSEAGDWVWLTLDYSYDFSGSLQQLDFEVVEYFEDGFPYRRDTFTFEAESNYIGGTQWLSVGPGPEQDWAPGRHWVYVYHEGRKVAEVEFEVTP